VTPEQRKATLSLMASAAEQVAARCGSIGIGTHETRLLASPFGSASYNQEERSAIAVLSKGSPVRRPYGTEILRISPGAVILTRLKDGGIPLLDSHNQFSLAGALDRITNAWIEDRSLMGKILFNATKEDRRR
jgi:hypothetical protein